MYYYFSSVSDAYIKLGGALLSKVGNSVSAVNIEGEPLVEVLSLNGGANNLNFFLSPDFLSSPPEFALVTDLGGGYLVKILNRAVEPNFRVIGQGRIENALVTVFNDNGVKISFDTPAGAFTERVDFDFSKTEICPLFLSGKEFIFIAFIGERTLVALYDKDCKKVFSRVCDEYSVLNGLTTVERVKDIAGHKISATWGVDGDKIAAINTAVSREKEVVFSVLPDSVKGFAFLEELLVGGDVSEFLSAELIAKKESIKEFFGDFIGVTTPPTFREKDEVGLVYSTGERTFRVEYATFTFENGKITNFIVN